MRRLCAALVITTTGAGPVAAADIWELSGYTGLQSAGESDVIGDDPTGVGAFAFATGWDGESLEAPPYWGLRLTYRLNAVDGVAVELTHAKVQATGTSDGIERLAFTDGLNTLTVNYMRRFPRAGRFEPYLGAGLGVAAPNVEVNGGGDATSGYQVTGPAATGLAGLRLGLNDRVSVFGEYKATYTSHDVDLSGGGRLETDILTHAVNFGMTVAF